MSVGKNLVLKLLHMEFSSLIQTPLLNITWYLPIRTILVENINVAAVGFLVIVIYRCLGVPRSGIQHFHSLQSIRAIASALSVVSFDLIFTFTQEKKKVKNPEKI